MVKVKDVGKSEPRASGVVGSLVVVSSVIDAMSPLPWVFWALVLSLSLKCSMSLPSG